MKDMEKKVQSAMDQQCEKRGYAAPVDVLMDIGTLDRKKYEDWRAGKIPYLEAVCCGNLNKLSQILKVIQAYAAAKGWKPSVKTYKHRSYTLRFSKSRNPKIEEAYATHYVMEKP